MTLILFPFHAELQGFLGGMEGAREKIVSGFRTFTTDTHPTWTLAICGQGKVEAALATGLLSQAFQPDLVLMVGSATALHPVLPVGDVVACKECLEIDFGSGVDGNPPGFSATWEPPGLLKPGIHQGRGLSGDIDLFDPAEKNRLGDKFLAQAYAWEGAGFYRALKKSGLPGLELRVLTESVAETRLPIPELKKRIREFFPRLRAILQSWEADLSNIG